MVTTSRQQYANIDLLKAGLTSGLPYVLKDDRVVLFSPYSYKLWEFPSQFLETPELEEAILVNRLAGLPYSFLGTSQGVMKIGLVLSTTCNMECSYCYLEGSESQTSLDIKTIDQVMAYLFDQHPSIVCIHVFGGEPTLYIKELFYLLNFLEKECIPFIAHVNSNGTAPTSIYSELVSRGVCFTISSDGLPQVHDKLRPYKGGHGTAKTVENCLQILSVQNMPFIVRTTIVPENLNSFYRAIDYWADLGVKYVHFEADSNLQNANDFNITQVSPSIYVKKVLQAIEIASYRNIFIISSAYMNLLHPSSRFCTLCAIGGFLINTDLSLSACYKVQNQSKQNPFIIGQWNSQLSVPSISYNRKDFLGQINVESFKSCTFCHAKYICSGGCPNRNYYSKGVWFNVEPWICEVKKLLVEDAIWKIFESARKNFWPVVCGYDHYAATLIKSKKIADSIIVQDMQTSLSIEQSLNSDSSKEIISAIEYRLDWLQMEALALAKILDRSESCL